MVEALIGRLDRWLAINRPDYYAHLLAGVSDAQLEAFEASPLARLAGRIPAALQVAERARPTPLGVARG